jgi:phosphoribosylanthranilate isomerase
MPLPLRVKICGVTDEAEARQAALAGADAVGLNFHPESPRYVDYPLAAAILRVLPPFVEPVGVFVNLSLRQICEHIQPLGRLRTVQWHGEAANREVVDSYPLHYVPAFPVRDPGSIRAIVRYLDACRALNRLPSAILVDAHVPGRHGGTGRTAPWELLASFRPGVPLVLAGGLTPENVAEAVRTVQPYAVDVASGVESGPGRKDPNKVWQFIDNARAAAARL